MKLNDNIYSLLYAAVVGAVCALFLTFASRGLRPLQQANMVAEENKLVLSVLDVPLKKGISPFDIIKLKEQFVTEKLSDGKPVYCYCPNGKDGKIKTVAYAFEGQGMWGPVKGFLSVDMETQKIVGLRISHQEETPGLGSDIATPKFQNQFRGKSMLDGDGNPGIVIAKGKGSGGDNEVDGISGATISGDRLQIILNECIAKILKENKPNG